MLSVPSFEGNPFGAIDYYVSVSGIGNGLTPSNPMSTASFLLVVLGNSDRVFFKEGDTF